MGTINSAIVEATKAFVFNVLEKQLPENFFFHSKRHTLEVLNDVTQIAAYDNLEEDEVNILQVSALLHDVGYVNIYTGHENQSISIASGFLSSYGIDETQMEKIKRAILATKVPQKPKDHLSEMLCDADLMYISYNNYNEYLEFLRKEWKLQGIADLSEEEFLKNTIAFFNLHTFHSRYGKEVLTPLKERSLRQIKDRLRIEFKYI